VSVVGVVLQSAVTTLIWLAKRINNVLNVLLLLGRRSH
jgi:hypothetical protein